MTCAAADAADAATAAAVDWSRAECEPRERHKEAGTFCGTLCAAHLLHSNGPDASAVGADGQQN